MCCKALKVYLGSYIKEEKKGEHFWSRHLLWFSFRFYLSLISILTSVIKTWKITNCIAKVSYINFNISVDSLGTTAVQLYYALWHPCHVMFVQLFYYESKLEVFSPVVSLQGQPTFPKWSCLLLPYTSRPTINMPGSEPGFCYLTIVDSGEKTAWFSLAGLTPQGWEQGEKCILTWSKLRKHDMEVRGGLCMHP